jgi:hypothetical protein
MLFEVAFLSLHHTISNLAPFAFPVRALRARTGNAGFDSAKSCRTPLVENGARFELSYFTVLSGLF